ncbi:hypothetical protein [Streptomyces sp. HPF1205]|uniref:hypothetical protein n=1 Tax=Streptomyces sp. HPF1205 TaxID=2873262 RepID=UPI001CEC1BBB|nr:hypothetical protein [Streptomyces sp. HPF1205]
MSLADECGTDVEIYRRYGSPVIYADSRTGAPEDLLNLLDALGLKRYDTAPIAVWHQVPHDLPENAQRQLANRACAAIDRAGYRVNISPDIAEEHLLAATLPGPAPRPEQPERSAPARTSSSPVRRSR